MSAPIWNIILEEGGDFDLSVVYKSDPCTGVDVSGYGARMAIRQDPDGAALFVGSVTGGQITISGETGQFNLKIGATTVGTLKNYFEGNPTPDTRYAFIIWPGASTPAVNPKRILQGYVTYSRNYGGP